MCGTIITDTTWSLVASPFDVCLGGVTIAPAATLTIQPGVTVQFDAGADRLVVRGALIALGTPAQPITFTGVAATPGSWAGLSVNNTSLKPALANLSHVTLEYGGVNGSYGAQLYVDQAAVTITHSLLRYGDSHGIYIAYGNPLSDIHDTAFVSNTRNAIQLNQPTKDVLMTGLSASGNGVNGVFVSGYTVMNGRRRLAQTGIPYVIDGPVVNNAGDTLFIEPGAELQFATLGRIDIGGELSAIGLPNLPITFSGQLKTPGAWQGVIVHGAAVDQAIVQLDYVTVEHGGKTADGANIEVGLGGQLVAHHSVVRFSAKDGVRSSSANTSISIINSQIYSNALDGVHNQFNDSAILATNNWWGDPNGPTSANPACSPGNGDRVTAGVLFRPVLTDALTSRAFPLSDAPILTLTPRRWFAPANGTTKVYFDIALRDANGAPMAFRAIKLSSSLGTPTGGGITDLNGRTLAYVVSSNAGEASVKATLDGLAACENALSPRARVSFNAPLNTIELFPDAPASYFSGDIYVTPMPVRVGVPTTIHAKVSNPLSVPITVDVAFAFAEAGIGLAFGPINEITGMVIPAHETISIASAFTPLLSGHYCVQVSYDITGVGSAQMARGLAGGSGSQRLNLNAFGGPMGTPNGKLVLARADKSFGAVSKLTPGALKIQKAITNSWWGWAKNTALGIAIGLGDDPPRQDYNQPTLPVWHAWPPTSPGAGVSITRAAAMNAASTALADVNAYGTAATMALDRYGGASEARNLEWAAQQANARLYYAERMGDALQIYASRLEDFVQVLVDEGETDILVTASDMITYQERLNTTGFTAQEIADAHLVGLTDQEIEEYRQGVIAAKPGAIAGNLLEIYAGEAAVSRELGRSLLNPAAYAPGLSISGSAGLARPSRAISNTMAQISTLEATMQLGNPLTQTALVRVLTRRIGVPADWMVSVTPAEVSLAPGERTTVTVTVAPGSLVAQGSIPRVAVEGYAGSQLLGGVVIDVVVPKYVPFAPFHGYFPLIGRQ